MATSHLTENRSVRGGRMRIDGRPSKRPGPKSAPRTHRPRPKQPRRRHIDPTTCERDYSGEEVAFMRAMDDYKRKSGRMFPTWSEVLEVLHSLGYRRVEEPGELPLSRKR